MKGPGQDFMFAGQLEQLIGSHLGKMPLEFVLLSRAWNEVVGERVAARTMPAWIRGDVLWVFVDGSGWMQELSLMKPEIMEQVNGQLHSLRISDIRWLQQPLEEKSFVSRELAMPDRDPNPEREKEFLEMTKIIDDSGCQQALFDLWQTFHRKMRL